MSVGAKIFVACAVAWTLSGCGSVFNYEDFTNSDPSKTEKAFRADSRKCEVEKDKHSYKIQGREFGFQGEHTGYLGCMQLQGWNKNAG